MTTIPTIATVQQSIGMRQTVARQTAEANKLTMEVATGMKQDVFRDNAPAAARSIEMRSRMAANQAFMDGNTVLQGKMQSMADALSAIGAQGRAFQSLSLAGALASDNRDEYRLQAEHTLEQIVNFLNTTYSGEHLFSGLSTDRKAAEIRDAPPLGIHVEYLGGPGALGAKIDEDTSLPYGLNAADPAFTTMVGAIAQVLNADLDALTVDGFEALRTGVTSTLNAGIEMLTARQARLGNQQAQLGDKIDAQYALRNLYSASVTDIEGVDVEEAAVRLKSMQVQLGATYEVTARLERMTLLDYL